MEKTLSQQAFCWVDGVWEVTYKLPQSDGGDWLTHDFHMACHDGIKSRSVSRDHMAKDEIWFYPQEGTDRRLYMQQCHSAREGGLSGSADSRQAGHNEQLVHTMLIMMYLCILKVYCTKCLQLAD